MKISIITVTLNNKAGLIRAIESVRSQTYKNVEHIIVDGGSTDGSVEVIKNEQLTMNNEQLKINNESLSERNPESNPKDSQDTLTLRNDKNEVENVTDLSFTTHNDILRQAQDDHSPFTNHYSLIFISEPDSGIYDAINKGIKMATGEVIGLLHSDDFYADEFVLQRYKDVFLNNSKDPSLIAQDDRVDAVYSDLVYVLEKSKVKNQKSKEFDWENKNGSEKSGNKFIENSALNIEYSVIRTWKTHKIVNSELSMVNSKTSEIISPSTIYYSLITNHQILNGWMPPHPTLFLRKDVFDKYGLYRTDMKIAADYEMILRLFWKNKISSAYLPITTYCMTIGGASNKSLRNILIKSSEDYKAMKMHGLPFPLLVLLKKNFRKIPQLFTGL